MKVDSIINGITINYEPYWKVIPKNWVRPDYEGYGCIRFPYRHEKYLKANECLCSLDVVLIKFLTKMSKA